MRITAIRATPVTIPLEAPYLWSRGSFPGFTRTIVEVLTDAGLVGLGDVGAAAAVPIIENDLTPRLLGRDPMDIHGAELRCLQGWRLGGAAADLLRVRSFGAIEMALWDLRGKAVDQPLYLLLGGAVRQDIPFTDYFGFRETRNGRGGESTPEAVVDYCLYLNAEFGTTFFEGKLFTADPAPALRTIQLLRERLGPDAMIRLDSNQAYSLTTARYLARGLEELNIRNWEDPVGTYHEMGALRQHTSIPFSTHGIDLARTVATGVPDAIVSDTNVHGGIGKATRFIGACEAMGIDFWCYSGDSGIGSAVYLHVAAAFSWIREPSQSLFRWQTHDVIAEGPFAPRDNTIRVPEGPGLGITLDPEKLAACHRLFVDGEPGSRPYEPTASGTYVRLPLS